MSNNPIVQVAQGKLKGREAKDLKQRTYYSFQGIPYAKPPLGKLRFKAPQPAEPWDGVLDATNVRSSCYCRQFFTDVASGSEDCLFINVYTPKLPKGDKVSLPVMFFVHGGGFYTGNGNPDTYGPEFLVSEDVILITFNYRLGALGFLSLPDPSLEVPGNAGFKDMVLAMKWVQQNISNFGGDPNNVTLFGESAGSASVQFLILSPLAKGLFHKAIAQSGSVFNPWAGGSQPNCVDKLAKYLQIDAKDNKTILQSLQSVPVEKLLEAQTEYMKNEDKYIGDVARCGPVVEVPSPNAFISQPYEDIIRKGTYNQVPLILGYNTYDGICMMLDVDKSMKQAVKPDFTDSELLVPRFFNLKRGSSKSKEVGDKIKQFYYGNEVPSEKNVYKFIDIFTDVFFLLGIYESAKGYIQTSSQPVYFYQFDLVTELNLIKKLFPNHYTGATHDDDLPYLFSNSLFKDYVLKPGSPEQIGVHRLLKFWTNFAKTGNPNPSQKDPLIDVEWKPAKKNDFSRLIIAEKLKTGKEPALERMKFWEELLKSQKVNIVF